MNTLHVVMDIESNGPCPGLFSLISVGLATVNWNLDPTFKRFSTKIEFAPEPFSDSSSEAYKVVGVTLQQHETFPEPLESTQLLLDTLNQLKTSSNSDRLICWSDNPAFDYQFLNYYFFKYVRENPLGHSARRIGDLWAGYRNNPNDHSSWKKFRKTRHTHDPEDDAIGNCEALEEILKRIRKL
jgi:hypothetical protein